MGSNSYTYAELRDTGAPKSGGPKGPHSLWKRIRYLCITPSKCQQQGAEEYHMGSQPSPYSSMSD